MQILNTPTVVHAAMDNVGAPALVIAGFSGLGFLSSMAAIAAFTWYVMQAITWVVNKGWKPRKDGD